ncbi:MAG: amidase [Archangium sp.]|nr:amidase [Archangium sp.]MDP3573625.1 amidase [Archangium sp.]
MIHRRTLLLGGAASAAFAALPSGPFEIEEKSLRQLAEAPSSRVLVERFLARIDAVDVKGPGLRSVLELNSEALRIADALDEERARKGPRGPLHGLPVLVKDNLDSADTMKTTAGSLALLDAPTPVRDAFVVQKLRDAGAVLLGKTNLSEWANLRGHASTSGWSARGGLTKNPYVLNRNTSGSSSGSAAAVAASLCAAAIGTETDGSIVSPASVCGVVGFKPTLGLVSRAGILPLAHSQDTAGPMTRSVFDAAVMLDAISGVDVRDAATSKIPKSARGFAAGLNGASLQGVRLGVVRRMVDASWNVAVVAKEALAALTAAGAVLVDVELSPSAYEEAELEVLLFEMKADLEAYLAARGGPMKQLTDLIAFNEAHAGSELAFFGQQHFLAAAKKGPLSSPAYKKALAVCAQARTSLHAVLEKNKLEALVAPTDAPAWHTDFALGDHFTMSFSTPAAVAGCPHLTVPMGFVGELPVGLSFVGAAWSDGRVLALGHAYEEATHARKPPRYFAH